MQEVEVVMGMLKAFLGFGVNGGHIAVVTGYALQFEKIQEQLRRLQLADPHRGWKQINLLTANTVQAEEYEIVILSLVKTKGKRGYLGEKKWANLVCTRHREAMYFVSVFFNTVLSSSYRHTYSRGVLPKQNVLAFTDGKSRRLAIGISGRRRTRAATPGSTRFYIASVILLDERA